MKQKTTKIEQQLINRAKELYDYSCGARLRLDCAKQAINERKAELLRELAFFDIIDKDLEQYALYISQQFKGR